MMDSIWGLVALVAVFFFGYWCFELGRKSGRDDGYTEGLAEGKKRAAPEHMPDISYRSE